MARVEPKPVLPKLRIVKVANLFLHERVEAARVSDLVEAMRRDGVLKNPPLVLPVSRKRETYVVLDGATRTMAFKQMDIPHALVQQARPQVDEVSFHYWNHGVLGEEGAELLDVLAEEEGVRILHKDAEVSPEREHEMTCLAHIAFQQGDLWEVNTTDGSLDSVIAGLNRVQAACEEAGRIERTHLDEWTELQALYTDLIALVKYRQMPLERVLRAAEKGLRLPAGMTRFSVSPRALRLHYPLQRLAEEVGLEQKQQSLVDWIQARVLSRKVRYYSESTYLFDE